jgi:uncharacterized membrane protein
MHQFAIALAVFIALHIGVAATGLRAALVKAIGEQPFRGLFSLASVAALAFLVVSYPAARTAIQNTSLFAPPAFAPHVTQALMLVSFLFVVVGLLTPGPTLAGFEGSIAKPDAAKGILRITRHPFLWGVALWALAHLISNGDRAGVMLFGGLGFMVLFGTRSIDRKTRQRTPEAWTQFAAVTSNVPFAAIVQGRNRFVLSEIGWRLLVALLVYGLVGYFHRLIVGVPAFASGF